MLKKQKKIKINHQNLPLFTQIVIKEITRPETTTTSILNNKTLIETMY